MDLPEELKTSINYASDILYVVGLILMAYEIFASLKMLIKGTNQQLSKQKTRNINKYLGLAFQCTMLLSLVLLTNWSMALEKTITYLVFTITIAVLWAIVDWKKNNQNQNNDE